MLYAFSQRNCRRFGSGTCEPPKKTSEGLLAGAFSLEVFAQLVWIYKTQLRTKQPRAPSSKATQRKREPLPGKDSF